MLIRCVNHLRYEVDITEAEFERLIYLAGHYGCSVNLAFVILVLENTLQECELLKDLN